MPSADFDADPADSPGWVANDGYRIIDRNHHVFSTTHDGSGYAFKPSGSVTDNEIRELMICNLKSLRLSDRDYIERAALLHRHELFDFTFQTATSLPSMSAAMHVAGCALIVLICSLAAAIPTVFIWWLFHRAQ